MSLGWLSKDNSKRISAQTAFEESHQRETYCKTTVIVAQLIANLFHIYRLAQTVERVLSTNHFLLIIACDKLLPFVSLVD